MKFLGATSPETPQIKPPEINFYEITPLLEPPKLNLTKNILTALAKKLIFFIIRRDQESSGEFPKSVAKSANAFFATTLIA